ncbi:MAG: NIPSNAP family containing protein [Chitinophagaceae bacterium]|nr:MAG: NIPSNAP family containing protein [Chitinophagaceae bacterium]
MKRRSFVKGSLLGTSLINLIPAAVEAEDSLAKANREYYELRVYTIKSADQERIIDEYLEKAAIPALNRLGSKNVGVFKELKPDGLTKIYLVIPFRSINDFAASPEKLMADKTYVAAGSGYLNAPATAPAYTRIESSLLLAFTGLPVLAVPEKKSRIFELRRYESASELAGRTKIKVFNEEGEIEIFKSVGLTPVFFGETLIGELRPNLTYMLTYDDMPAHDASWKKFSADPRWLKIKAVPEYADARIVSKITAVFLVPTAYSQV